MYEKKIFKKEGLILYKVYWIEWLLITENLLFKQFPIKEEWGGLSRISRWAEYEKRKASRSCQARVHQLSQNKRAGRVNVEIKLGKG